MKKVKDQLALAARTRFSRCESFRAPAYRSPEAPLTASRDYLILPSQPSTRYLLIRATHVCRRGEIIVNMA